MSMPDDIILNKVATIERCLQRIVEEYYQHEDELETNYTRQDSIVLNLLRACESSIDLAMHCVRTGKLGIPQDSRNAFDLLEQARIIDGAVSKKLKAMVGFRNIAVHNYQKLAIPVLRAILEKNLEDFTAYTKAILSHR